MTKVYNVYYKGGYIGYAAVHKDLSPEAIKMFLAKRFTRRKMYPKYADVVDNLTVAEKVEIPYGLILFQRMVFNEHELGDDLSLAGSWYE